jgi:hypothetical protein
VHGPDEALTPAAAIALRPRAWQNEPGVHMTAADELAGQNEPDGHICRSAPSSQ